MPNAKNLGKQKKCILTYGPTGSGKSTLFTTIPGKIFSYVFDPGMLDTISGVDLEYSYFPPDAYLGIGGTKDRVKGIKGDKKKQEPKTYINFEDHVINWLDGNPDEEGRKMEDFDVIGLNSLTTLQLETIYRTLWMTGRPGQVPELSDYFIVGDAILRLVAALAGRFPGTLFLEAHDVLVQGEVSKKIQNQLDLTKILRQDMPRLLTDIWVSVGESSLEGSTFKIQTLPSKEYPMAKNSFKLNFLEDLTIDFEKSLDNQGVRRFWK